MRFRLGIVLVRNDLAQWGNDFGGGSIIVEKGCARVAVTIGHGIAAGIQIDERFVVRSSVSLLVDEAALGVVGKIEGSPLA